MNKNNEPDKSPVDDLFARKLGNATLPTATDGFARLQARMGQAPVAKQPGFVVWRNPNVQRAMAIAACLLLVCLFGWLYLSNGTTDNVSPPQLADAKNETRPTVNTLTSPEGAEPIAQSNGIGTTEAVTTNGDTNGANRTEMNETKTPKFQTSVAKRIKTPSNSSERTPLIAQSNKPAATGTNLPETRSISSEKALSVAQTNRMGTDNNGADGQEINKSVTEKTHDQVAAVKPAPATERVLIVTIAEPEKLVAARQAVKMEAMETALATVDRPEKAGKPGFWEQVQRVKHGEIFSRSESSTDDRGLLNRAYDGLRNSIDKDKTIRQ